MDSSRHTLEPEKWFMVLDNSKRQRTERPMSENPLTERVNNGRMNEAAGRAHTRQVMFGSHWFKSYLRKAPSHRHNTGYISLTPPLQVTEFVSILGRASAQWEERKG